MAITLITVLSVPANASAAVDPHAIYGGVIVDNYYLGLARCETGNNLNHSTRSYTGMFGVYRRTFQHWSNHTSAKNMTARQQVKVADAIAFKGYTNPDGLWTPPTGPWGWGCLRREKSLQAFICKSSNKLVTRWKRHC
jgi:hypothetical protein